MKTILLHTLMVFSALLFLGCEEGSSPASEGTAFYVDSAVEGVTVTCGSKVSLTTPILKKANKDKSSIIEKK
jgi:hypothetical protein